MSNLSGVSATVHTLSVKHMLKMLLIFSFMFCLLSSVLVSSFSFATYRSTLRALAGFMFCLFLSGTAVFLVTVVIHLSALKPFLATVDSELLVKFPSSVGFQRELRPWSSKV